MPRRILFLSTVLALGVAAFTALAAGSPAVAQLPGVSQVAANKPSFAPGETIQITVIATDDNGELRISSSLPGSTLNVTGCTVNGDNAAANTCTGTRTAVDGQGTRDIYVDTEDIDTDDASDPSLTVKLNLVANCSTETAVTVDADQPNNAGPDLVTINCIPATPTPTPTNTPSPTPTTTPLPPTSTPSPIPTAVPPTSTPVAQVLSSGIQPPNTGDGGLK